MNRRGLGTILLLKRTLYLSKQLGVFMANDKCGKLTIRTEHSSAFENGYDSHVQRLRFML